MLYDLPWKPSTVEQRIGRLDRIGRRLPVNIVYFRPRHGLAADVVRLFEQHKVNIIEIYHQRVFTKLPAKDAFIDIECEARDTGQLDRLIADLQGVGLNVHPVEIA